MEENKHSMTQTMVAVEPAQSQPDHPNPHLDSPSWWSYFFAGGYSWRWFRSPHLYFHPNLEYTPGPNPFTVYDGMGRERTYNQPFECYLDPLTGKVKKLYVQAPESLCRLSANAPNATWRRTPIRNATSILLRIANLPFRHVDPERRDDIFQFQLKD